jgi:hypothetical protein
VLRVSLDAGSDAVAPDGAELRVEPGNDAGRVRTLPPRTPLELIGPAVGADGTSWRQVRDVATGATGYVREDQIVPAIVSSSEPPSPPAGSVTGTPHP